MDIGAVQPGDRVACPGSNAPVQCYNCGKPHHYAKDCKEPKQDKDACFYCGRTGHQAKECRKKKADKARTLSTKKTEDEDDQKEIVEEEEEVAIGMNDEDFADFRNGSN